MRTIKLFLHHIVEQQGQVVDVNYTVLVHVSSRTKLLACEHAINQSDNIINVNQGVTIYITEYKGGIGRCYPVTNGEGNGIVEEPVPVIVVGEVG